MQGGPAYVVIILFSSDYALCAWLTALLNPPIFVALLRAETNTKTMPNKIITALNACPLDSPNNRATPSSGCLNASVAILNIP